MKIAIASVDKKGNSEISSRGGRSPYYLIFDEKGELLESVSNPFAIGGGGAGIAASKMLADMGIDIVIAGKIGEKMADALDERGIRYTEKEGDIKAALKDFLNDNR